MKKTLSIILAILMVVTMLPMAVLPASAISKTQDGFVVHVTYGVCKYCGDKHGIESVDIKSISVENGKVTVVVGEVEHPMTEEHYIEWIALKTKFGTQKKMLTPGEKPAVCFAICDDDEVEAVYAYCNLHSLWMAEPPVICELDSEIPTSEENYKVCKCNNVSYFDILNEINKHSDINNLLDVFEKVKDTTHCSTGCGGCYDKVIGIISDTIMNK